ncbi:protein crumbs [Tribolium castaneum]|uniref:Protein crumbs-like Protein n=1 Tax=Tribolium castaneum TaxID=7070 RepID=D6WD05_TRICA|nr:PREDICTED: protein crumbs [Tribolium castaneum]EEZ98818.2 Protein crumbs-like Protein [Tribolium castaneum]|eukprot:XP_970640.2 PREDICTED: protein crumbs [Tribolium castaneum]
MGFLSSWRLGPISVFLAICCICSINCQNLGPSNTPEAYFNGSAYLRLQTTISPIKQTGLSFRTCTGGGLFSQQQNDDFLEVSVNSEGVIFFAKTAGKQFNNKIFGNFINNKWHVVFLYYEQGNLTLRVDNEKQLVANSSYQTELITNPGFYNEGASVLLVGKQFNGCLLEGPSLVFNHSIIYNHNVKFEPCPIPEDSCILQVIDYCVTEPCMRRGTCHNSPKGYNCTCQPRYTGKNCEMDLGNPCERNPAICKNGATCNADNTGVYTCTCPPNFTGKHCEQLIVVNQQCQDNPCQNGATCVSNGNMECLCLPGFDGPKCEFNIDDCKGNPCKNGGICRDGLDNFTCDCSRTGYTGRFCQININECETSPCLNHGTCFDTYGGFLCQCPPGYGGAYCQNTLHACSSQQCLNEGQCINTPDGFKCICPDGFAGERCEAGERQISCDGTKCPPYADCVKAGNNFGCICKPEYPGNYPNCSIPNICANNPCKNQGICTSWNGYFNCSCSPGFTGQLCEIPVDSQPNCNSNPCQNGGSCFDKPTGGFYCNCTDQWMGTYCNESYDVCKLEPCQNNATCISSQNKRDFVCECLPGFEGQHCERNIDDCVGVTCPYGQVCFDLVNDHECRCPLGYKGENCTIDADPCAKKPCMNGATCQMNHNENGFVCNCLEGFSGERCETDIDECKNQPGICNEGICQNELGGFQCYCRPGYTGERCDLDFDECLSMPCRHQATCLNKVNNYECICPPGYEGKDCSININECEPMPCMNGSTCIDGINKFTCNCQPGLTGKICEINIDDCESSPCLNGAECIDGLNSYTCNCTDTGYTGTHCETNINDCIGDPCENGASCEDKVKDYDCHCYAGYSGKNCEIDINECDSNPCKHNGTCYEHSNQTLYQLSDQTLPEIFSAEFSYDKAAGYECLCVDGVTGENCEIDINECESNPCFEGTCVDKIGGFACTCDEGFEGERCDIDINECERFKPCVYGKCWDRRASYYCECDANYGGKNCSVGLTGCDTNPCLNSGTCKPYLIDENIHRFNCSCPHGYYGQVCEKITTMSLSGKSLIIVNTSREEGYDIQFRFKTTLGDGLLALGKGLTYYILELSRGRLNLHSSLLNKWEGVFIGSNLNDSQWQRVFVAINSTHLVLSANDEQTIYPISFNEISNGTTYTSFPLTYIGGIPSNLKKLTHGKTYLVGCTEDVLINGEWILPPSSSPHTNPAFTFQEVEPSCKRQPQCNPNPCHSGGHCTDLWVNFKCTCGRPYLGDTCQYNYTAATFGYENITDSLVTVYVDSAARRAVRTIVDISMFIRTRQPKGQIFYLGSLPRTMNPSEETYIAAQLEGGELLVRIQFNGTPEAYTVGGVKLDNGYDHLIEVIRNVTLVQVKLNGTEYFRKTISATGTLDAQVLFLGGPPQTRPVRQANDNLVKIDTISPTSSAVIATPLSNVHFKGIIQDVQISNGSSVMIVEFFPLNVKDLDIPKSFGEVRFDETSVLEGVRSDNSCRINPCLHNGVCENTWNDYRCICTRGFKGKDCSDLEFCEIERCPKESVCKNLEDGSECVANATFDGKTPPLKYRLVTWPNSTKIVSYDTLEVTYRTRSWGTIFFAKHENDFFAIFIYHNEVVVEWSINKMGDSKRFRKDYFEGQWLTIYFEYKNSILKGGFKDMVMDEAPNMKVANFDIEGFTRILTFGDIYVAGSDEVTLDYQNIINSSNDNMTGYIPYSDTTTTPSTTSNSVEENDFFSDVSLFKVDQNKSTDFFKGCINEIRIGGILLPFFPSNELFQKYHYFELYSENRPQIGCILCHPIDCYNQGVCANPLEFYKCNCPAGFAADDCSIDINECEKNECQNNATCIDLVAEYECKCEPGFEGEHCETDIDECASNPCRHGGTCNDAIGTFKCECPEGFAGKQCEAPILITCDNKPCKEGATCKTGPNEITGNNFTCICTPGMEGPLCDTPFCYQQPCINNGTCVTETEVPFCNCTVRGFEGKFCEINIDDCDIPTGNPCQHGGICNDQVNKYECDCNGTGWGGLLCENDINECVQMPEPCGVGGKCENFEGGYNCVCDDKSKCGHSCLLDNPCDSQPCVHGDCTPACTDKADYICKCREEYTGKNCSDYKVAASQMDHINILYIIIPIVLILSVGIAIGLAVLVNVARSKRATRGTYSPSAQEFCNPRVELDHVLKPPPEERLI